MKYTFYQDKDVKELVWELSGTFIVLEGSEKDCNPGMIMTYCPIGQHGEASLEYIKECKKITKEKYKKLAANYYTPEEYLS